MNWEGGNVKDRQENDDPRGIPIRQLYDTVRGKGGIDPVWHVFILSYPDFFKVSIPV
jgi:hypothetical protein